MLNGQYLAKGPYRVRNEYRKDLEVNQDDWFQFHKISPTQRQRHIEKLMATDVKLVKSQKEDGTWPMPPHLACHVTFIWRLWLFKISTRSILAKSKPNRSKTKFTIPGPRHPLAWSILCRKHKWRTLGPQLCGREAYWKSGLWLWKV